MINNLTVHETYLEVMMKHIVGTIKEVWRYPVKSMEGELVDKAQIQKSGLVGDRCWAIRDDIKNEISSVRKSPRLLNCTARYTDEPRIGQIGSDLPHVNITMPDGTTFNTRHQEKDALLSDYLKKKVSLWPQQPRRNWKFYQLKTVDGEAALKKQFNTREALPDMSSISWFKLLELSIFSTPLGRFYDIYPLHIVTSNSLEKLKSVEPNGDFQTRRFRPNLFIESSNKNNVLEEFDWVGGLLYIGDTIIRCESRTVRCSMPGHPQVGITKDSDVLRALEKHTGRHLGINASVIKTGSIKLGDSVFWEPELRYSVRRMLRPISGKIRDSVIQRILKVVDKLGKK